MPRDSIRMYAICTLSVRHKHGASPYIKEVYALQMTTGLNADIRVPTVALPYG